MKTYSFGDFTLADNERNLISSDGTTSPLTPRVHHLLIELLESGGRLVTKDELMDAVWPDSEVEEANLTQGISTIRKALKDSTFQPRYILTVPSRGYRFVAPVEVIDDSQTTETAPDIDKPGRSNEAQADLGHATIWSSLTSPQAMIIVATLAVLAVAAFALYPTVESAKPAPVPSYKQLTFERGTIWTARYMPNGGQIVYSATLNGGPKDLYLLSTPSTESQALNLQNASLLSVSKNGELAVLQNEAYLYQFIHRGVLSRMPVGAKALREVAENVQEADWDPEGDDLVIVRWAPDGNFLEYPIGTRLAETRGYFSFPRLSSDGNVIAYFEHAIRWDNRGHVVIIGKDGKKVVTSEEWNGLEGLAWNGDEVWFTASKSGEAYSLYAMKMDGTVRSVEKAPSNLMLHDVSVSGSALLGRAIQQTDVYFDGPDVKGSELSWLHLTGPADLARDGSSFLFTHFGAGSGKNYSVYLRKTDGSPAIRLGEGRALALSPNGQFAVSKISNPEGLRILPTRAGTATALPAGTVVRFGTANWFPNSDRIILTGSEEGKPMRTFVQDLLGGDPVPITPEGIVGVLLSPDGDKLIAADEVGTKGLFSLSTNKFEPISGLETGDQILRWTSEGDSVFVFKPLELPIRIFKLDPRSGKRALTGEIVPRSTSGLIGNIYLFITPDGTSTIYGLRRYLIDLFEVEGLK